MENLGQPTNIIRYASHFLVFLLERNLESGKKKSYLQEIPAKSPNYQTFSFSFPFCPILMLSHLVHSRNPRPVIFPSHDSWKLGLHYFLRPCIIHSVSLIAHWNQRAQKLVRLRLNHSLDAMTCCLRSEMTA